MSLYTTGPGGIKIHIKITIKSESIQDSYKVNTFSCQIIALHLRLYYFNLNPKHKNPTRPSDVSVHQANHAAPPLLLKQATHALEEEREVKNTQTKQLCSNEFFAHLSSTTVTSERDFLGLRLMCK